MLGGRLALPDQHPQQEEMASQIGSVEDLVNQLKTHSELDCLSIDDGGEFGQAWAVWHEETLWIVTETGLRLNGVPAAKVIEDYLSGDGFSIVPAEFDDLPFLEMVINNG
jgi:hypothetical protein